MAASHKIKALLQLTQKNDEGLAAYLGINRQSLRNKFNRNSFSADDLIRTADYCGAELKYVIDDRQSVLFDIGDARETDKDAGR